MWEDALVDQGVQWSGYGKPLRLSAIKYCVGIFRGKSKNTLWISGHLKKTNRNEASGSIVGSRRGLIRSTEKPESFGKGLQDFAELVLKKTITS